MLVQKSYDYYLDPALDLISRSRTATAPSEVSEADDYLRVFQQKWGDLQDESLWNSAEQARDMDAAFAVAALYHKSIEFFDRIKAMVISINPWHRWASVLVFGVDRLDVALPALCELIQEDFQEYSGYSVDYWLLTQWRILIPDLLVRYQNPVVIPSLTQALRQTLRLQEEVTNHSLLGPHRDLFRDATLIPSMQYALVQAIAAYHAWGALTGLPASDNDLMIWRVMMAATSVRDRFETHTFLHWSDYPAFKETVQLELTRRFGMTTDEQEQALHLHEKSSAFRALTIRVPYRFT